MTPAIYWFRYENKAGPKLATLLGGKILIRERQEMRSYLTLATVLASAWLTTATPAKASLLMMVGSTTISDNGAGDNDARTGVISYIGAVGNFNVNLSTQTGTFSASPLYFDFANSLVNASAAGQLVLKLTSTGLTAAAAASQFLTQFSGNFSNGSAMVTAQSYLDTSNAAFGTGTALAILNTTSTPFSLSAVNAATATGLFSLTEVLTVNTGGSTSFSLDTSVSTVGGPTAVPEPVSVGILGISLIGLGLTRRRRRS